MQNIQELNATWEQDLDDMHAQLWERMKAAGATAKWTDPLDGAPSPFTEQVNGEDRRVPSESFYEFTIWHGRDRLAGGSLGLGIRENHAVMTLVMAANVLEQRGIQVMPRT